MSTIFVSGSRRIGHLAEAFLERLENALTARHRVVVPRGTTGFAFHAVKDREMTRVADYGLMIWDGASPGTIRNALRLVQRGKASVIFDMPAGRSVTIRCLADWGRLVARVDPSVRAGIRDRATPSERAALA